MATARRPRITDALRQRVATALQRGALRPGDRLPTTRELAIELSADPRVVSAAYRTLVDEGLVEIRPRAGVFVAPLPGAGGPPGAPPAPWLAEVIAAGVVRGLTAHSVGEWITRATRPRAMQAAVIAATLDQALGVARELRDDFGIGAQGVLAETLRPGERLPRSIERAHLLVGTELTAGPVGRLAERLGKRHLVIEARPDVISPELRMLLARVAYIVVADPRFAALVRGLLDATEGGTNARVLVAGRDAVSIIPPEAPTYVTEAAREQMGRTRLPGRLLAPVRTLSEESLRRIARALVERSLATERAATT